MTITIKDYLIKHKHALKLLLLCFGTSAGLMALIYFLIGVPLFGNSEIGRAHV